MQSICWTGRLLSRALRNGLSLSTAIDTNIRGNREPHFVSVVCGFPKDFSSPNLRKGQFGDDAWFSAANKTADVIGVADGVGGWRSYGIDPGEFSSFLMKTCERLVQGSKFKPGNPANLLARSYFELLEHKKPILGSSTACVVVLNRETSTVYTANIGDSGFMVVRAGAVVHRSSEQQHYFNTPFQLSLPPPGHHRNVVTDPPESADLDNFKVEEGDVILVATDGVFDNVPDSVLLSELQKLQGQGDAAVLQATANTIAWMARNLSFNDSYMSPFAKNAKKNGIDIIGGKPDDITVLLATVAI